MQHAKKNILQLLVDIMLKARYIMSEMNLAEKLKKLRIRCKLSMSQVARISERAVDNRGRITQGYISRLESGKENNPSLMKLVTLCSIYDIEPGDLFIKSRKKSKNRR